MLPIELAHEVFQGKKCGTGWSAKCPAHDDHNASLSYGEGEEHRLLLKCHAGCTVSAIVEAKGLTLEQLFEKKEPKAAPRSARVVAEYPYHDEKGELLYVVVRYDPKCFKQKRPGPNGTWLWTLQGVTRVPYGLKEILESGDLFLWVTEGEKDADRLRSLGMVATTAPQGAGKWKELDEGVVRRAFEGRDVIVTLDNDRAGRLHGEDVARRLHGIAKTCRLVSLPGLPLHGDVSDWLDLGHTDEELFKLSLETKPWDPDTPSPNVEEEGPKDSGALDTTRLSDVKPRPIEWLWPGVIPKGKISLVFGDPGQGKSLMTMDLAARLSRGDCFPRMGGMCPGPQGTLLITVEDDLADTVAPRLIAAKADMTKIIALNGVRRKDDEGKIVTDMIELDRHVDEIERAVELVPECGLVIIDPVTALLGETDSNDNAQVRRLLVPLSRMAERKKVAILLVSHNRKSSGKGVHMSLGSLAFTAAARSVWAVTKDDEDPEGTKRYLLPVKVNVAPDTQGYSFRIVSGTAEPPHIVWSDEPVAIKADAVFKGDESPLERERKKLDTAKAFLKEILATGPRKASEVFHEAAFREISRRTMQRASDELWVVIKKVGFPAYIVWTLPEEVPPETPPPTHSYKGGASECKTPEVVKMEDVTTDANDSKFGTPTEAKNGDGVSGVSVDHAPSHPPRGASGESSQDNTNKKDIETKPKGNTDAPPPTVCQHWDSREDDDEDSWEDA